MKIVRILRFKLCITTLQLHSAPPASKIFQHSSLKALRHATVVEPGGAASSSAAAASAKTWTNAPRCSPVARLAATQKAHAMVRSSPRRTETLRHSGADLAMAS